MINTDKPATTLSNSERAQSFETWGSIQTTWATETRTWAGCASLMVNSARQTSSITNSNKP